MSTLRLRDQWPIHSLVKPMGFPLAQMIKNPPAMQETWVRCPGLEEPLEEGMATHSSVVALRIPVDRGAWRAAVHGVAKCWTRLSTGQHRLKPTETQNNWADLKAEYFPFLKLMQTLVCWLISTNSVRSTKGLLMLLITETLSLSSPPSHVSSCMVPVRCSVHVYWIGSIPRKEKLRKFPALGDVGTFGGKTRVVRTVATNHLLKIYYAIFLIYTSSVQQP